MNITVEETIRVEAPVERVFAFTQDWAKRPSWDHTILGAEPVAGEELAYRVRGAGGFRFLARYKLFRAPERTSLAMSQASWPFVTGGGGSWLYRPEAGGTVWTQTNTLALADRPLLRLVAPLLRWRLGADARKAMLKAKRLLERS